MASSSGSSGTSKPTYLQMIIQAITETKLGGTKGVSRQKIAGFIRDTYDPAAEGARFNTAVRQALKTGIDSGVLCWGETHQRYKLTEEGRTMRKEMRKKSSLSATMQSASESSKSRKKKAAAKKKSASDKRKSKGKGRSKSKKKKTETRHRSRGLGMSGATMRRPRTGTSKKRAGRRV